MSSSRTTKLLTSEPCPPDYDNLLSTAARSLRPNRLRDSYAKDRKRIEEGKPLIVMAGGVPAPASYPVVGAEFRLRDGTVIRLDEQQMVTASSYANTDGYGPLRELLQDMQITEHKPPQLTNSDHPVPFFLVVTSGAQEGLRNALHCLIDKEDSVLVENVAYSSMLLMTEMYARSVVTVRKDEHGMIPADLEDILSNWELNHPGKKIPKLLYVITAGNNPVGYNWSEQRVVAIYTICRKYNILILEDGAYQYVQFEEKRNRSFQSVDVDGRVIRCDTVSKIIGPGFRIGWVTGPKPLIQRMERNQMISTVHASVLSQILVYNILKQWGPDRFEQHVTQVADIYKKKAKIIDDAAHKHLTGLCTWITPKGGMFIWLTINGMEVNEDFKEMVHERGLSLVAGNQFEPGHKSSSVRLAFSAVKEEDIEKGVICLADAIRECQGRTNNGVN